MNNTKHQRKRSKLSISILFCFSVLIFICDSCFCFGNNKSSKTKTTLDREDNTNSAIRGKESGQVKTQSEKNGGTLEHNKKENKDKNDEEVKERDQRARDREARKLEREREREREKAIAAKKAKEERERLLKEKIQGHINKLRTVTDTESNRLSEFQNRNNDENHKEYFSALLDFQYTKAMENLIDTAPEDPNKNKDIDTWVANIKNFTEEFKEYVDKIHQLDASIDETIRELRDTYNKLIQDMKENVLTSGWRRLKVLETILCTGNSNKFLFLYQATDFLSPEDYVWMILLNNKRVNGKEVDTKYNSLEKLQNKQKDPNFNKDDFNKFCKNIEQIGTKKKNLVDIKTNMERFLNKQP